MCGICGFTSVIPSLEEETPKAVDSCVDGNSCDAAVLKAMCDVMAHRGPDGEGQYLADGVALGHRRLSLIDLEGGAQPLVYGDGEYVIVFNGEIYNYRDLRTDLEQQGWSFKTNSDTEVLLVGYLAWGEAVLDRVRGMFAFAIWSRDARELFCARDFFGIKPFYYTIQKGQFIFASEIKCILEHPAYERELNEDALEQYLCFQFSALPETFFKGIYKLPPAHCMRVHEDGTNKMVRYWKPEYHYDETRSLEETTQAIHEVMQDSVRYHNVADVEVGSFLSSGIDSSYMAACLGQENPDIKTFTVGFAEYEGERDEISWAAELADTLHISNKSKHITEAEFWDSLSKVQWHMDEPSADPSAVALYFVDQLAAQDVKAVLSGEGADEFFGGYRIYQVPFSNQKVERIPRAVRQAGAQLAHALHVRGEHYLQRSLQTPEDWYYTNANGVAFSYEEASELVKRPLQTPRPQTYTAPVYAEVPQLDEPSRMQYLDLYFWLVGDILLKTDKMSMAHSLESRVPFLDRKVFELSCTIPTSQKVDEKQTKIALRDAAECVIPPSWAQKEKLGFPVPVASWLREERYYQQVADSFTSETAERYFNTEHLMKLLDEHRAGADRSRKVWIVYMFLIWHEVFFGV